MPIYHLFEQDLSSMVKGKCSDLVIIWNTTMLLTISCYKIITKLVQYFYSLIIYCFTYHSVLLPINVPIYFLLWEFSKHSLLPIPYIKNPTIIIALTVGFIVEDGIIWYIYRVYKKKLNRFEIASNFAKQLLVSSFLCI